MIRLAVAGAAGRMGKRILTLAMQDPAFLITGGLEHGDHPQLGKDLGAILGTEPLGVLLSGDPEKTLKEADVLIDFTHPSAAEKYLEAAKKTKTRVVLGTTGLDEAMMQRVREASGKIAVVQAPNMSVGMNLLFKLAALTAETLDENYDIEITETHHRMKKDAPSGTAVKLLEIVAAGRKRDVAKDAVYGRQGETGARRKGEIGVFALRGGDVVGDHTVSFIGDGERVELHHRASSRDAFAQGALRAAKFVAQKPAGLYDMQKVLEVG